MDQVLRSQVELVARYDLAHEVIGIGLDARLRILPTPASAGSAGQTAQTAAGSSAPVAAA